LCQSSDSLADLAPDTQLRASSPFYVLFGNQVDALPVNYERFLMNGLRQSFDLPGVPIRISKKRATTLLLRK
jgi:predicted GTPase